MSELTGELIAIWEKLSPEKQGQVLAFAQSLTQAPFDYQQWQAEINALHAEMRAENAIPFDVQALLDEVRNEAS